MSELLKNKRDKHDELSDYEITYLFRKNYKSTPNKY